MVKKKRTFEETAAMEEPVVFEEADLTEDLRVNLEDIKTYEGVIGYILRNSTSAAIDLKDPAKIVDYAILSSSAFDASKELTDIFELGQAKSILVEGKASKMLSLTIGGNRISIFMEKNADTEKILGKLR
jgi:predicted regulator of Ras-like GTPase activity (Roadblock/LC7/MglB family)